MFSVETRRILSIGTGWQYRAHCCGGLPDSNANRLSGLSDVSSVADVNLLRCANVLLLRANSVLCLDPVTNDSAISR